MLRGELGLHGPWETCGSGVGGDCTVLIDHQPISSCLLLAVLAPSRPNTKFGSTWPATRAAVAAIIKLSQP